MVDLNQERKAFEADQNTTLLFERIEYIAAMNAYMPKFEYANNLMVMQAAERFNFGWSMWQKAKAQAVPETQAPSITLTCADLKEAFDFGAPDGEKDQFQMETEMTIKWLEDGYDGPGYYCWYADLPEEGCIKLGKSESGAEG
ncbi:hypothetical protein QZK00_12280 [Acinetobacter baumannii]|nr:hypothetical protein [Acinetobacter baumannii]